LKQKIVCENVPVKMSCTWHWRSAI